MKYRFTEIASLEVSVSLTLNQLSQLKTMAQALLNETEEAKAALALIGWSRWDARRFRDDAKEALSNASDIMKQEARSIDDSAKAQE